ncbi:hypothetical protein SOVF_002140 [Spinacia oleracea]|nr:hypothetical protein SOVF_002140 [Spinacia oleracea]
MTPPLSLLRHLRPTTVATPLSTPTRFVLLLSPPLRRGRQRR